MTNVILILVVCSTVITSIVNAVKPAYKKFAGERTVTINVVIAFALGILCAFSVAPMLGIEVNAGLTLLIGMALGTGSNIFFDIMELIKSWSEKIKATLPTIKK